MRVAYPAATFSAKYDDSAKDYLVTIRAHGKQTDLYWAGGRMLSKDDLPRAAAFWPLFYNYPAEVPDPACFTKEEVERIRERTSPQNRRETAGGSQAFFDAIYDCSSRCTTEQHIKAMRFFGKSISVHEDIISALRLVETDIQQLAPQEAEVRAFVNNIGRIDGYNWREITDRSSRSFHSYGIAVDILPKNWGQKNIYWAWRRDKDPNNWMLLPLDRRWMPPASVIRIFERHGFIWGGKWTVWDNMHFEYHKELTIGNIK